MVAYQTMGCTPTWTCAPYQTTSRPVFGQQMWNYYLRSYPGHIRAHYPDLAV